ncbi:uncharacterized protein BX663DRAFT_564532 [Cokeromyces recurvatus]|uniref:uncharacterized protein n=1 Tax=Cokeromyces recurvatus TaxID=90255 RepID=UPI00221FE255|nr:uncharacterized protein BX663DRAFT_564532 [Cokeromyces recurvatus]KAI7898728.1 hypothetical protein BX663DRAFT_564532 [Cokeromyces recurvatus]
MKMAIIQNDNEQNKDVIVSNNNFESEVEDSEAEDEVEENTEEGLLDEYPDDAEDIDCIHMRVTSIPNLRLERFNNLQSICLRQNLIIDIEGLDSLSQLKELDLYDNKISHMRGLNNLTQLRSLDLSFNKIKHIKNIDRLTELTDLYFVSNKISKIENLNTQINITNLELGANRIRVIENLDNLSNLTQLWLGKNKITKLEGLSALKNLRSLSIQSNRLTKIEGLEELHNLEELYMSHNAIEKLEGLEHNLRLNTLDIANNLLTRIENLSHLPNLEEFWANNNKFDVECYDQVEKELGSIKTLHTVYLEGNPMHLKNRATYRNKIRLALPNIKQIDATSTTQPPPSSLPLPSNNDHLQTRPYVNNYYSLQEEKEYAKLNNTGNSFIRHSEEHCTYNTTTTDGYAVRPQQYPLYSHIKREIPSSLNNILPPLTSAKSVTDELPEPWYTNKHKLISTTTDTINNAELGDTKKHKRRKEMTALMEELNQDFLKKRERLYVEKLDSINQELKDIHRNKHALYLDGLRDLELMRQKMIHDSLLLREYQNQVTDNQFRLEIYQAEEEYTAETQEIRERLFNVLEEKRKKLKEDKDNCELNYDVILDPQLRVHKRNLRKRGSDHAENKTNKKKQMTGPSLVFKLKEDDILSDLQLMRVGLSSSSAQTASSSSSSNSSTVIGSPTAKRASSTNKKK